MCHTDRPGRRYRRPDPIDHQAATAGKAGE